MHITHTQNDGFATVCTTYDGNDCVVSFYSSPTINPFKRIKFADGLVNYMSEISFNPYVNSLCLVKGSNSLYRIDPASLSYIEKVITENAYWNTIDLIPNKPNFILAGINTVYMNLARMWYYEVNGTSSCTTIESLPFSDLGKEQVEEVLQQKVDWQVFNWNTLPVKSIDSRIVIDCQ